MRRLSLFILAFLALKAVERIYFVESWPLTHAPMFSARVGRASPGYRIGFLASTDGTSWQPVQPRDVGLGRNQYHRRLLRAVRHDSAGAECARMGAAFNAHRPAGRRLRHFAVFFSEHDPARPDVSTGERLVTCLPSEASR